jgi:imidazolonepropionase-like amidohydrolase
MSNAFSGRCVQAVVAFLLTLAPAPAQDSAVVLIRAGRVVDVVGGRVLSGQTIVVRDGRIERITPSADAPATSGASEIDLRNATVLPGLIDAHVHLNSDGEDMGYSSLGISLTRATLKSVPTARRTLEAGFTTVRSVGAPEWSDVALRDAIEDGDVVGPRIVAAGPALGITGGHCDNNLLPPEFDFTSRSVADGPWAVRTQVRENVKYGSDLIKFCATGGVLSRGTRIAAQQYTQEEMDALVDEAHKLGLKVAAHAHSAPGIKAAIRAGVDSVEHASLLDDEAIALAREHGTALSMDVYVSDYILTTGPEVGILPESLDKEREVGEAQRDSLRRAHAAGVRIVFGSDAGVYPHGNNARQFDYMVRAGMTPMEAIQAATIENAELLGAIAPGRWADIIAVDGDPLSNVRELEDVDFVMKGGQVIVGPQP